MGGQVSRQQYYAIKNSLTKKEHEIINFYELQWALRHNVPTIEEVAKHVQLSQVAVNYHLQRKLVIRALEQRGVPYLQHTQSELTATQVAVAITMMNFADTRSNEDKLDQLGINSTQYYAWMNDPQFKNLIDTLANQNLVNIKPTAIGELTKKINQGDWNAVRYYLDTTGAMTSTEAPQTEQLMRMLIEIIQTHIKDPKILVAIAEDIRLATANRTLEAVIPKAAITSTVVDDTELANAKKQLGFG